MLNFSSDKKKIVIVADPHNNHQKLDTIIKKEDGDINIMFWLLKSYSKYCIKNTKQDIRATKSILWKLNVVLS